MKISKKELTEMIQEVSAKTKAVPTQPSARAGSAKVVATVPVRALKEAVRNLVKENLSAVQAVAQVTDSGVIQQAMKVIAQAAVAQAALPDNQKNLAVSKIADELGKQVSSPLRMALLRALKEMGTPEQVPQQAPGAGTDRPSQGGGSPFGA